MHNIGIEQDAQKAVRLICGISKNGHRENMISNILSPWDKDHEGTQFSPIYEPL